MSLLQNQHLETNKMADTLLRHHSKKNTRYPKQSLFPNEVAADEMESLGAFIINNID